MTCIYQYQYGAVRFTSTMSSTCALPIYACKTPWRGAYDQELHLFVYQRAGFALFKKMSGNLVFAGSQAEILCSGHVHAH